jgi:hypothetical protein
MLIARRWQGRKPDMGLHNRNTSFACVALIPSLLIFDNRRASAGDSNDVRHMAPTPARLNEIRAGLYRNMGEASTPFQRESQIAPSPVRIRVVDIETR